MDIKEIEKIRGLVNTSPILSLVERAEWLGLLGVMNDRQLGELEGILGGNRVEGRGKIEDRTSGVINAPKATMPSGPVGMQMPKMSHIMNLPKLGNIGQANSQIPAVAPQIKKPSFFADKLKSIFAEKELPAGDKELDLPQGEEIRKLGNKEIDEIHGSRIQGTAPKPFFPIKENLPVVPKIAAAAPKVPLPPVPKPKNISSAPAALPKVLPVLNPVKDNLSPALPSSAFAKATADKGGEGGSQLRQGFVGQAAVLPSALYNSEKPPVEPIKRKTIFADNLVVGNIFQNFRQVDLENSQQPNGLENMPEKSAYKIPDDQKFSAGISFPAMSETSKAQTLKTIKESLGSAPLTLKTTKQEQKQEQEHANEPALNSLEDLAKLLPEFLDNSSLDFLVKKIKLLTGKYGYFEVIFNIEKSQAYKNYLGTGLKMLSGQSGFENLAGDYLSREQFEKFADLLAKIQTG